MSQFHPEIEVEVITNHPMARNEATDPQFYDASDSVPLPEHSVLIEQGCSQMQLWLCCTFGRKVANEHFGNLFVTMMTLVA